MIITVPIDLAIVARIGPDAALDLAKREAERIVSTATLVDNVLEQGSPFRTYRFRA